MKAWTATVIVVPLLAGGQADRRDEHGPRLVRLQRLEERVEAGTDPFAVRLIVIW